MVDTAHPAPQRGGRSWREALRDWRTRIVADPAFQRAAASFPLTRWIARRKGRALFELFLVVSVGSSVLLAIGSILLVMTLWMACSEMNDVDPEESRRGWLLLFFFLPGPWQALAVWRLLQLRNGYHRVYERLSLEKKTESLGFDFPRIGVPQFVLMVGLGVVFGTYTLAVRLTPNLLFEQIIAATHGWILVVDGMGLLFYIWLADRTLNARDWFSKLMRAVRSEHAGESS